MSCSDEQRRKWGGFVIHTMSDRRSRALSSTWEALERSSFQTGLEPLELKVRLHFKTAARSSAFKADSCREREEWHRVSDGGRSEDIMKVTHRVVVDTRCFCVLPLHRRIPQQQSDRNVRPSSRCRAGAAALCYKTEKKLKMSNLNLNSKKGFCLTNN